MQILEALQCKNIIRHEEVSRILEHMSGGESVGDVVFGTMYLAHRGSVEDAGAELRRLSSPQQTQRHHQLRPSICQHQPPASSPGPGARWWLGAGRGGAQHSQHSTLLISAFAFRSSSSSGCPEPGVQAPGSRPALLGTNFHQLGRGATAGVFPLA